MKKLTLSDYVLMYVQENGSITSYEAFRELGVTRLSAVIFNLKKMGYNFKSETISVTNRYNKKVRFSKYFLADKD